MRDPELELDYVARGGARRVRGWIPFWVVNSVVKWINMVGNSLASTMQSAVKRVVSMIQTCSKCEKNVVNMSKEIGCETSNLSLTMAPEDGSEALGWSATVPVSSAVLSSRGTCHLHSCEPRQRRRGQRVPF